MDITGLINTRHLCFTSSGTCRKTYSSNTSLSSVVSSQSDTLANNPYIVEDEFHVVWDFDKEAEGETHVSHTSAGPSKPGKNLMVFHLTRVPFV